VHKRSVNSRVYSNSKAVINVWSFCVANGIRFHRSLERSSSITTNFISSILQPLSKHSTSIRWAGRHSKAHTTVGCYWSKPVVYKVVCFKGYVTNMSKHCNKILFLRPFWWRFKSAWLLCRLNCFAMKIQTSRFPETSSNIFQATKYSISDDFKFQIVLILPSAKLYGNYNI
jgi:hypothetical protein